MYHRVLPEERARETTEPGMYVTPRTFEMHLRALGRHFAIRPLAELAASRVPGAVAGRPTAVCYITFDDGWRDFLEYAFPVLQKLNAPATVFLPTAFIGTRATFWSERLARMLRGRRLPPSSLAEALGRYPDLGRRVAGIDPAAEDFASGLIAGMKNLPPGEIEALVALLSRLCGGDAGDSPAREFLDWDEVRRLKRSGLVEFGSHTETHRILTRLSDGDIDREIHRSKEALAREAASDPGFVAFCFPNGDFDRRILELVRAGGYDLAVSTQAGWNRRDEAAAYIRRIGMHEDVSASEPLFLWRLLCGL
jgi:peptidoglycan/xylan/chitin deacetylase (PgdA/CDA1 family)